MLESDDGRCPPRDRPPESNCLAGDRVDRLAEPPHLADTVGEVVLANDRPQPLGRPVDGHLDVPGRVLAEDADVLGEAVTAGLGKRA